MKVILKHGHCRHEGTKYIAGDEFAGLVANTVSVASCLGSTDSGMGAWQSELELGRFVEAAILDRICLELTARGYVPKIEVQRDAAGTTQCTYQGKGEWRIHQPIAEAGGEITRYATGTQHFLDLVPFPEALEALCSYVGHVARRKRDSLKEEAAMMAARLEALGPCAS